MRTLYLDIFSGISGDMFLGAMIDLGVNAKALEGELQKLKLDGWHLHASRQQKAGIDGVKVDVHLAHEHQHTHADGTTHSHAHSHHTVAAGSGPGPHHHSHPHPHGPEPHSLEQGRHGGRLVRIAGRVVEVTVFEENVPPRFRLYFSDPKGKAVAPLAAKSVQLRTIRGLGAEEIFNFSQKKVT